jgi:hypothetical protein
MCLYYRPQLYSALQTVAGSCSLAQQRNIVHIAPCIKMIAPLPTARRGPFHGHMDLCVLASHVRDYSDVVQDRVFASFRGHLNLCVLAACVHDYPDILQDRVFATSSLNWNGMLQKA